MTASLVAQPTTDDLRHLDLEELMNVEVVSTTRSPERLPDAPATVVVVTAEQIRLRGYESLEDVLRDLPGFDFVDVHGTWPTIWAQRGLYGDENKRTLVLIDGIVENNLLEGSVLGGPQYSLHFVERIEVMSGPASALYGANAFSGIVNIVTKSGRDPGLEARLLEGSEATRSGKLLWSGRKGDLDYMLSGSLFETDGPVFTERHPEYTNSYVDGAYSLVGRLGWQGWRLGYHRFDRPMGEGLFSNSPTVTAYGLPPYGHESSEGTDGGIAATDLHSEHGSRWHSVTETAFLSKKLEIGSQAALFARVVYRQTGIAADSYEYDFRDDAFHRDPFHHESDQLGAELQVDYRWSGSHDLIAGLQLDRSDVERGYRGTVATGELRSKLLPENRRVADIYENVASFAQYRFRTARRRSTFILGLRYDHSNVYGGVLSPRLGFVSKLADRLSLKVLYGQAYRRPNSFELFTETTIRIANPELEPEDTESYEVILGFRAHRTLLLEASLFHNDFDDVIVSNVTIGDIDGDGIENSQNRNAGAARVQGAELRLTATPADWLALVGFLSFQDAEQSEGSERFAVPNVAKTKAMLGVTVIRPGLGSAYFAMRWVGDRTTAVSNPAARIDGYFRSDLFLRTRRFLGGRADLSLAISNLLDESYEDPGIRSASGGYFATRHPQPGRRTIFGLTVRR